MALLEEPLLESAPVAFRLARELCQRDGATGRECSPVHGFWQYLRILGFVTTPAHHARFLGDAFNDAVPRGGNVDVLVSGAVDYSMLAHALWACGSRGAAAKATVIDICATPLALNDWYARRVGQAISTAREDVRDHRSGAGYDVVCTHSFLSQFPPADRRDVARSWRRLLKPGGRVITVNRIRAGNGAGPFTYSSSQVQALEEGILRRAAELHDPLDLAPEELVRSAAAYARHRRIYPVETCDEIGTLLKEAGLAVEYLVAAPVQAGPLHASAASSEALYALVVARRAT
jgi:SAM-dependent methyltransferase